MKPAQITRMISPPLSWSEIPWGEYYRAALEQQLAPWWPKLFGYHLLKIGTLSSQLSTEKCGISHQVSVGVKGDNLQVMADPCSLPFAAKSVDACVLAHTLSFASDPHRILREVDRVLVDDGWLILTGFNPTSLIGLGKLVPKLRNGLPYSSRMFSMMRMQDWLQLLNYEVLYENRSQILPWNRCGGLFLGKHLPVLGCLSVIVARKRTVPLTPTALRERSQRASWRGTVGATKSFRKRSD
ncbi:class I SAM-dependent methyltransferase [Obesumbacterium proteus]|uniref:class I SAM-dependent methyltransferase n=1 Tax=Obesumbacterium proteus TaxID=82983 RepID=UPI00242B2840|nr:class I SAM-dependent methyltransferase [Obesumbacterium proteus]